MTEDIKNLHIIHYPDPRLRQTCGPVTEFGDELAALVKRMFELMETGKGVGLAAPQVGITKRLFVMNPSGEPDDKRVLVNPAIRDPHGSVEAEEGCLSLPGINVQVRRAQRCRVTTQDLEGHPIEFEAEDLPARICQHETDHLNGILIIDRMGPSDRIATRQTLRALEDQYQH
ncbi:MAG: peptide deformylase [Phycisphaerae bacterium]|nr:peptide deformylase [Phycisphaerae bacterium]